MEPDSSTVIDFVQVKARKDSVESLRALEAFLDEGCTPVEDGFTTPAERLNAFLLDAREQQARRTGEIDVFLQRYGCSAMDGHANGNMQASLPDE